MIKLIYNQAIKTDLIFDDVLNEIILRNWIGFKADWINKNNFNKINANKNKNTVYTPSEKKYYTDWDDPDWID